MSHTAIYKFKGGEFEIEYYYTAGSPGSWDEPPEREEVEILTVKAGVMDITEFIDESYFSDFEECCLKDAKNVRDEWELDCALSNMD